MSGDHNDGDDPDFLDDEFVVEGLGDKEPQDDLDQLFELPPQAAAPTPPAPADEAAPDELFTDHTADLQPSEQFGERPAFDEQAPSSWNGAELELDDPAATTPAADAAAPQEIELDAGGTWLDGIDAAEGETPATAPGRSWLDAAADAPFDAATTADADDAEAVYAEEADAYAEDDAASAADDEAAADAGEAELEDAPAPVLAGPQRRGLRLGVVVGALAASLTLVTGGAVVVLRPDLVGLRLGPQPVTVARVERPAAPAAVAVPAVVATTPTAPATPTVAAAAPAPQPSAPVVAATPPVEPAPATSAPQPATPVAVAPTPVTQPVTPAPVPPTPAPQPTAPVVAAATPAPAPAAPSPVAATPAPQSTATKPVAWPVAAGDPPKARAHQRRPAGSLVRISDDTMVGEADASAAERHAVEGVIPGVRAFAQLRNGNFFIGSVKAIDGERVLLRTPEGEVALDRVELVRLTGLGSADYEALQKATAGFVRLTNSNKLVGGILSQVADDHVVLEFRSNRVILPRTAVGEVVESAGADGLRFDLSGEEDDWLRKLAERELGKDRDAHKPKPPTAGKQGK